MSQNKKLEQYYQSNNYVVFPANTNNSRKFSNLAKQVSQLEKAKKDGKKGVFFYNAKGTKSFLLETKSLSKMKKALLKGGNTPPSTPPRTPGQGYDTPPMTPNYRSPPSTPRQMYNSPQATGTPVSLNSPPPVQMVSANTQRWEDEDFINFANSVMQQFQGKVMFIGGSYALKLWSIFFQSKGCQFNAELTPIHPSDMDIYGKYYEIRRYGQSNEYREFAESKIIFQDPREPTRSKPYENVFSLENNNGRRMSGNAHLVSGEHTYNSLDFGGGRIINVASLDTLQKGLDIRLESGTKPKKAFQAQMYLNQFRLCKVGLQIQTNNKQLTTQLTPQKSRRNTNPNNGNPQSPPKRHRGLFF